jgi:hypothetical protein
MGSLWRYGRATGELLPVLSGFTNHIVKAAIDVATVGSGLNRLMQRQRLAPVAPAIVPQWRELKQLLVPAKLTGNTPPRAA